MRRIARDPEKETLDEIPEGPRPAHSFRRRHRLARRSVRARGRRHRGARAWVDRSAAFWTYVIHGLTDEGLRVVAYDLRGHGDSEPAKNADYAIPRFGEDLEAVLAACVPEDRRAVVAGHSLGRDVDRLLGREARRRAPGPGGRTDEHRRREPDRRAPAPAPPGIAQAVNRTVVRPRIPGQQGAAAALLDTAVPRCGPLYRVWPGRLTGPGGVLRADAGDVPAGRARRRRDGDVRDGPPRRAARASSFRRS